jgi:two-component system chemotaxis sensor kinase CheA
VPATWCPPDAEILKLIFEPGFSTAEKVTNLSGRGVGMDVVRRNIEALRGSIEIGSEPGQGSSIEIRLPLTLAIIDGFLVGVGSLEVHLPARRGGRGDREPADRHRAGRRGRSVRRTARPGAAGGQPAPAVRAGRRAPSARSVVVVQAGRAYGVIVDQLLGQHQTVIKPLGRLFRSLRGISGSSILGNGEVALIFDVASLSQLACRPTRQRAATPADGPASPTPSRPPDPDTQSEDP